MNKYLIKEETLVDIANNIKNKTGISEPINVSDFASVINEIELENLDEEIAKQEEKIASQDELIASITAALEGKVAGGSGTNIETCTVNLIPPSNKTNLKYLGINLNILDNEKIIENNVGGTTFENSNGITIENVICGSFIIFDHSMTSNYNIFINGIESDGIFGSDITVITIPHKNNETITIELQNT